MKSATDCSVIQPNTTVVHGPSKFMTLPFLHYHTSTFRQITSISNTYLIFFSLQDTSPFISYYAGMVDSKRVWGLRLSLSRDWVHCQHLIFFLATLTSFAFHPYLYPSFQICKILISPLIIPKSTKIHKFCTITIQKKIL